MFIILYPYSNTNPSHEYRVVDGDAWQRHVNSAQTRGYSIAGKFDAYDEALTLRDQLNRDLAAND